MTGKDVEGNGRDLVYWTIPTFTWKDWRKSSINSVRMVGPCTWSWTLRLLDTRQTIHQINLKFNFHSQYIFFFFHGLTAPSGPRASSLSRLHDHIQTHHIRYDSSGRVISPKQRLVPDNTNTHRRYTSMLRWYSNPRFQLGSGRRPTP
jgi:hypothetical protein